MENLRVIATLVVVAAIAILSIFQMQIRGYEKVGRINEWVLYIDEPNICETDLEKIHSDETNHYYLPCSRENYIIKSGFEERSIEYVLDEEFITITELDELIELIIEEK
jgi:hypothetical protein